MSIEFQSPEELQNASSTHRSHRIVYNIVHKFEDQNASNVWNTHTITRQKRYRSKL